MKKVRTLFYLIFENRQIILELGWTDAGCCYCLNFYHVFSLDVIIVNDSRKKSRENFRNQFNNFLITSFFVNIFLTAGRERTFLLFYVCQKGLPTCLHTFFLLP